MKLLKYSNERYAGMRNQDVTFKPGMNVIIGDNETGKSTMISGIYDTLLKASKTDKRRDKEFIARSFPAGGGSSIDGRVKFDIDGQEYTVKKEWEKSGKDYRSTFITESTGDKYTNTEAENKIKELLGYGESVYSNVIFGNQNNESEILDWFYKFLNADNDKKVDEDIAEVRAQVSGALSAAEGISEDEFIKVLEEKIDVLGARWDVENDMPEKNRGIDHPWAVKKGAVSVLAAYYEFKEKERDLEESRNLIRSLADSEKRLGEKRNEEKHLKEELENLRKQESAVKSKGTLASRKNDQENRINNWKRAEKLWPGYEKESELLEKLKKEESEYLKRSHKTELESNFEKAKNIKIRMDELSRDTEKADKMETDLNECSDLERDISSLKAKLSGAELHARVKILSELNATVETASGKTEAISDTYDSDISGYAKITIPGVAEIMIAPQDIDVDSINEEISSKLNKLNEVLQKNDLSDMGSLEAKINELKKLGSEEKKILSEKFLKLTQGRTLEDIQNELSEIETDDSIDIRGDIESAIKSVLENKPEASIDQRLAVVRNKLDGFKADYGTLNELEGRLSSENKDLKETNKELEMLTGEIMDEAEFENKFRKLKIRLEDISGDVEELIILNGRNSDRAENVDLNELENEKVMLQNVFESRKKHYRQYLQIRKDFNEIRENTSGQYDGFYELFNRNLEIVTGGRVQVSDNNQLKSNSNLLETKNLLSKGTKQTILLAFRLALMKYYYSDESGVIVLDDTLLDMDPERRARSVELLKTYAEDNQVIFTTCDPGIADMLGGNRIEFGDL